MAGFLPRLAGAQTFPAPDFGTATPVRLPQDILNDLNSTQDARNGAALQLIAPQDSQAHADVLAVFRDGPDKSKLAMALALGTVSWPQPDFEQPLLALLSGRDPVAASAAARALMQYHDDPQVMNTLIDQARQTGRPPATRLAVIQALASFAHQPSAQQLVDLLEHGDSDAICEGAGDALIEMTARTDLDHNAKLWAQWWDKNKGPAVTDQAFHDMIIRQRGEAFAAQLAQYNAFRAATEDLLRRNFWSAPRDKQTGILLGYLQSPAPQIRVIGAKLVLESATVGAPAPAIIQETQRLLSDPSAEVRAAAASALSADYASASALSGAARKGDR